MANTATGSLFDLTGQLNKYFGGTDPSLGSSGINSGSSSGSGDNSQGLTQAQQQDIAKLILTILSDPGVMQSLQQGTGGQASPFGPKQGGYSYGPGADPNLWGASPGPGPVQWLGGMPPGYNDKVAQQLARGAIAGNVMRGGLGQQIANSVGGMLGGGNLGQIVGSVAGLAPYLASIFGG